jgi:phosphoglycerol transferase
MNLLLVRFFFFFFYSFLIFLVVFPFWLKNHFGIITLDQLIFNIKLAANGSLRGDSNVAFSFYKVCIIYPIILSFFLNILDNVFKLFDLNTIQKFIYNILLKIFKIIQSSFFYKFLFFCKFFFKSKLYLVCIFVILIMLSFSHNIKIDINFENDDKTADFLKENFIDFKLDNVIEPTDKKNLILIYAESLEKSFSEKKYFKENLIKPIIFEKKNNNFEIEQLYQIGYLGFSIASFISSQCGIPLVDSALFDTRILDSNKFFLPNAYCLSDIFKKFGYLNIFISSDDLDESNQYTFLKTHGYQEIFGIKELSNLGYETSKKAYYNRNKFPKGGIHDSELLKAATNKFDELQKYDKKPFLLTVVTLDTHVPTFANPECIKNLRNSKKLIIEKRFEDSFVCLSLSLNKFINHVLKVDPENTNILLVGDHLYMSNFEKLNNDNYQRYVFNKFFTTSPLKPRRKVANNLDLFPSIIEFMNFKINDGKLGLGFSVFYDHDLDIYSSFIKKLNVNRFSNSKKYLDLWGVKNQ